jgi:hypothetical protein
LPSSTRADKPHTQLAPSITSNACGRTPRFIPQP